MSDLAFDVTMAVFETEIPLAYTVPKAYTNMDGLKGDIMCEPPPGTMVGEGDAEVRLID